MLLKLCKRPITLCSMYGTGSYEYGRKHRSTEKWKAGMIFKKSAHGLTQLSRATLKRNMMLTSAFVYLHSTNKQKKRTPMIKMMFLTM